MKTQETIKNRKKLQKTHSLSDRLLITARFRYMNPH
jgi:hypothetical protein